MSREEIGAGDSLKAVAYSDLSFAAGSGVFSSGIEALVEDVLLTSESDVMAIVRDSVKYRWNTFDRVFLAKCWTEDTETLIGLDSLIEISTIGHAARSASRRAGRAMLDAWARLDDPGALAYQSVVVAGAAPGHQSAVQATIYRSRKLSRNTAESLSCWALVSSLVGAAVKLGVIGHVSAQRIFLDLIPEIEHCLSTKVADDQEPVTWTPVQDIATERHPYLNRRLFAS